MNRLVSGALVASFVAILLAACDDGRMSGFSGAAGAAPPSCNPYASCEACTPVLGCGWCYAADGTGTCAPGQDRCLSAGSTWTWNPDGCRVAAMPGVAEDAGSSTDASAWDSGSNEGEADIDDASGDVGMFDGNVLANDAADGHSADVNVPNNP